MLHRYLLTPLAAALLLAAPRLAHAQTGSVGIGTTAPDASAALDIVSTGKGLLLPRVAAASAIASPAPGLLVYQTGSPAGFYYNSGTAAAPAWQQLATAGSGTGDNLGNHTATQALNLNGQKLTGGGTTGLRVRPGGGVAVDTLAGTGNGRLLTVAPDGTLQASAPIQDQALTNSAAISQSLGTVATGSYPISVALNAAGTRAYVTTFGGNTLQTYDVSGSGAPVSLSTVATGGSPAGVALNAAGTRAYVTTFGDNTLQTFDVSGSGAPILLGTVPAGSGPIKVALNPAGTRAYVVNSRSNTLQTFDVSGSGGPVSLGTVATSASPWSVAVNPAGTRAYVTHLGSSTLQTYDVSGSGVPVSLGTVPAGSTSYSVAVNAAGTRAYVANYNNTLQTFDVSGSGVPVSLGTVPAGSGPYGVAANAAGTRAYVVNNTGNTLQTYDVSGSGAPVSLAVVATGSGPAGVVVNPAGTRAYVVNSGSNTLQAYDVGSIPTVVGIRSDGTLGTFALGQLADNLGNHTATQNLNLGSFSLTGTTAVKVAANLDLGPNLLVGNGGSTGLALTSTGRVGIGTSGPTQQLDVEGGILARSSSPISNQGAYLHWNRSGGDGETWLLNQRGGGPGGIRFGSATTGNATTEWARFDGSGNLGLGTTTPGQKLEVNGNVAIGTAYDLLVRDANHGLGWYGSGKAWGSASPDGPVLYGFSGGLLGTNQNGTRTTALAWTNSGNVGIGTTGPSQKLDVRGNVRLGDDGSGVGTGPALEWVGPGVSSDPVGIYRVNPAADQSELRVVVGDGADANDKFVVGRMPGTSTEGGIPTGTFTPTFSVSATGLVTAPGLAGTGTRVVTADATGTLATQALPTDAQQLSKAGSTISLTNGGSVTDADNQTLSVSGSTLSISGVTGTGASVTLPGDNLGNHTATQNLSLGTNALVGNGGTAGLSVDAAGNAQLPAANAYRYAAPKAYAASYGPSDFQANSVAAAKMLYTPGTSEQMYVDQSGSLRVGLHLPQGAVITSLLLYYTQSAANASNYITLDLLTSRVANRGTMTTLATFTSAGTYTALTPVTITPSSAAVVDNNTFLYTLRAFFSASSTTLTITAVTVNYTITQAE